MRRAWGPGWSGACRLAALACLFAFPGAATAAGPPLVSSTSIAGDRTGYVQVELNQPLDPFSDEDEPQITLEGGGAILGLVLRSEQEFDGARPTLEIIRLDRQNAGSPIFYGLGNGVGPGLPAGPYRLYLVVERAGRVTLDFPSLPEGELDTAPVVHTPFEAGPLPHRSWPAPATVPYGRTGTLTSDGLIYSRAVVEDAPAGARLEACSYPYGSEAQAGDQAYGPGCPGGDSGFAQVNETPGDMGVWSMTFASSALEWGHGGNFTSPAPVVLAPTVDAFAMWLSYDFAPAPPSSRGPEPGTGGPPPPPRPPSGRGSPPYGVALVSARRLTVRRGRARVPVACSPEGACRGWVRLGRTRRKAGFQIPAASQRRITVRLSKRIARRVAAGRRTRTRLVVTSLLGSSRREQQGHVTLMRARRR